MPLNGESTQKAKCEDLFECAKKSLKSSNIFTWNWVIRLNVTTLSMDKIVSIQNSSALMIFKALGRMSVVVFGIIACDFVSLACFFFLSCHFTSSACSINFWELDETEHVQNTKQYQRPH